MPVPISERALRVQCLWLGAALQKKIERPITRYGIPVIYFSVQNRAKFCGPIAGGLMSLKMS